MPIQRVWTLSGGRQTVVASGSYDDSIGAERAADAPAPGLNQGVVFYKDNGSGKTQLCVRFNTGAVQVIATQP